ncbi:MFS family permease [Salirhabdus euzebyi]|uniref:MFS family permease n=1 Tax=Salirhabdus euzebyi TaxID=394506 RepID=A0A841Q2B9_9BACI|nr:MFS transporter [Salirhabdus euzebyi]MBB6452652.1 MFS family permease [Salirhabdus euzebyi]
MKNKNYGLLIAGVGISSTGDFMYLIAINLIIYHLTGSATLVAALWVLGPLAGLVIKSWSGGFVDRHSKKKIMIYTDILRGMLMVILLFSNHVWLMLTIIFLVHSCSAFFRPASQSYIVKLVPKERRSIFNGMFQAASTGGIVIGPAIAGGVLLIASPSTLIFVNAITFFLSAILISFLPSLDTKHTEKTKLTFFHQLRDDRKVVWKIIKEENKFVKMYIVFQLILVIGMSLDALEWVYSNKVLGLNESQYSLLMSVCGIGYVAGSLLASKLPDFLSNRSLVVGGTFVSVAGFIGYAFSISFSMVLISFTILGLGQAIANASMLTLFQNTVPPELIARFSNFFAVMISTLVITLTITLGIFGDISVLLAVRIPVFASLLFGILLFLWSKFLNETKEISPHGKQKELGA